MSITARSNKQLQEALADFAMELLCRDVEFQQWLLLNVTKPSLENHEYDISYNKVQEFNRLLEKKLRG